MSAERQSTRIVLLAGGTPAVNLPVLRPVDYRAVQELTTTGRLHIYILMSPTRVAAYPGIVEIRLEIRTLPWEANEQRPSRRQRLDGVCVCDQAHHNATESRE